MIKIILEFLIVFIICYILYFIFVISNKKNSKYKAKKPRVEDAFLTFKYKIDFKKVNYKKYLHLTSLVNSFIIALCLELVQIVNGLFFQILLSFVFLVPLILITYSIIGKYYQKKGMIKDVQL